ncbi:helix-turn-helix domain-containing protein [Legionella septentrionalis]|uniref:XRE family transcriptional regulator n=1 Tax=Legionella septentrionalis TaxID=2498109 RepID=A0A3S0V9I7_9GAMM|nr:helix-turn-helix transcriptional regulator [Legionella septentrionalis]RUQ81520.1 XRE family transcriptional regulator [Legionella septentrionalis]
MRKKHPALITLGTNIRELRKSKGFSQESFADEAGLDRTYMGGVERGERNLATLNLIRIAAALNIEVGELFPPIKSLEELVSQ